MNTQTEIQRLQIELNKTLLEVKQLRRSLLALQELTTTVDGPVTRVRLQRVVLDELAAIDPPGMEQMMRQIMTDQILDGLRPHIQVHGRHDDAQRALVMYGQVEIRNIRQGDTGA